MSKTWKKVEKFQASSGISIDKNLKRLKKAFKFNRINDDETKIRNLIMKCSDETLNFIKKLSDDKKAQFATLKKELLDKFSRKMQIETRRQLLKSYHVRNNPNTFKKECQEYSKLLIKLIICLKMIK
uniref:Uncharacterized protein n=1 Tax=Strongyloides venezuelensis TaxID=75913 RepID=A0A0K0FD64_STRVS